MAEKQKGDPYVMKFIDAKGGVKEVVSDTGLNRQTVWQVSTGRNAPSFEFIKAMMATYSDFDLRESFEPAKQLVAAGEPLPSPVAYAKTDEYRTDDSQELVAELRKHIAAQEKQITTLEKSNAWLQSVVSKQLGIDLESGKAESVDCTTPQGQYYLPLNHTERKLSRPHALLDVRNAFGITPRGMNLGN